MDERRRLTEGATLFSHSGASVAGIVGLPRQAALTIHPSPPKCRRATRGQLSKTPSIFLDGRYSSNGPRRPPPKTAQAARSGVSQFAEAKNPPPRCRGFPLASRRHPETWSSWISRLAASSVRTNDGNLPGSLTWKFGCLRSGMYRGVRAAGLGASASRVRSIRPRCEFHHRYDRTIGEE